MDDLTTEQKELLSQFLDQEECPKLIEDWLNDFGLEGWKAKVASKVLAGTLFKLVGKLAQDVVKGVDEGLKDRSPFYAQWSAKLAKFMCQQLDASQGEVRLLRSNQQKPEGIEEEDWKKLKQETQFYVETLSRLETIQWTLGEFKANITLTLDIREPEQGQQPSKWLRYYYRFIPLLGREREMEMLKGWCDENAAFGWMTMTGDAGIGKTRLAQEFALDLKEMSWDTGFLTETALKNLIDHDQFLHWEPIADTFLVIDYAATRGNLLKPLFERIATWAQKDKGNKRGAKIRVLLLERHADLESGWLQKVFDSGEGASSEDIKDALHGQRPYPLPAPEDKNPNETMMQILQATFDTWKKLTKENPPELQELEESGLRELRRNTEGRPIYLQMAGLHACEIGNPQELIHWGKSELLDMALKREYKYIRDRCQNQTNPNVINRAGALLFFTGPIGKNEEPWLELLKNDSSITDNTNEPCGVVSSHLADIFGEKDEVEGKTIEPMEPDLIGAAFAADVLKERDHNHPKIFESMISLFGGKTWSNLIQASVDMYGLERYQISLWLLPLLDGRKKKELDFIAYYLLPKKTVELSLFAVNLYETKLKLSGESIEKALTLNNLGYWYGELGRRDDSLRVMECAIEIIKELDAKDSDVIQLSLANGFNNLGILYGDLRRYSDALEMAKRAIEIYERLSNINPGRFEQYLAKGLTNIGNRNSALGRYEEAIETTIKAIKILERLVSKNPREFELSLANSLNNLASNYKEIEKCEEGVREAERAVEIYDRLSVENPDAFERSLANGLTTLGYLYSGLERHADALEKTHQAVKIYERLSAKNPDAFELELVLGLNNLGKSYSILKIDNEALRVLKQAVGICNRWIAEKTGSCESELAMSLHNLGFKYHRLGEHEEALQMIEQAVVIRERLSVKSPNFFEPKLAQSFWVLGLILNEKKSVEAVAAFANGIQYLRRMFFNRTQVFRPLMVKLLTGYLDACEAWDCERDEELVEPILEKLKELEKETPS
jgi:tetratricopeptide (TPR) repeat protein